MSSSQEVTLIVDDVDSSRASFLNGFHVIEDPALYGGRAIFLNNSDHVPRLDMNMSFHGTSISFYGIVGGCSATLDRNNQGFWPVLGSELTVWYQSPPLPDDEHNFVASNYGTMYIDYALVKVGSTTDLSTKIIFVDDAKMDEIWYTGQWWSSVDHTFSHASQIPLSEWRAANRTASYSNTTGDSFEFQFAGTSISVYGILPPAQTFTLEFIVDGTVQRREFSQEDANDFDDAINYNFYKNPTLSPGNHTLIVNVSNILEGSTFWFDYITYTPSFSFINEKPAFIRSSEDQQLSPHSKAPKSLPIGPMVGIIIAGLLMVTSVGFFYYLKRRSSSRKEAEIASRFEPFTARFVADSKLRPTKWRELFPSEDVASLPAPIDDESTHPEPPRIQVEVQQRNDEIASLTVEMRNSDSPTRSELFARISMLTMEVERLVRENAPPEYGGSDVGQRPSPCSGTLPSYNDEA
ncbi:hypothetical protein VNI00_014754 [Paramarasmius palmivorus]|uniref:Transmembrane protein n=1 Tax=Paramarasmius palmivorus TaxID=297713 RepID=A0AAW0BQM5_9AGAR